MFLVVDTLSNNVVAECDSFARADAFRIEMVGHNPTLAEYIQVVDMAAEMKAFDAAAGRERADHLASAS